MQYFNYHTENLNFWARILYLRFLRPPADTWLSRLRIPCPYFPHDSLTEPSQSTKFVIHFKIFIIFDQYSGKEISMKFLVGYDGSNEAEAALKEAQKHANVFKADIYIVTSLEQSSTLQKAEVEKAEGELEYLRTPFNIDDIPCETTVSVNYLSAGEDLIQFTRENNIDKIFIGVKKRSKVGKLVFGSTAQYVILNAPCPVVVVK
jgi:nucleotide-binding universal stress UspA family protein